METIKQVCDPTRTQRILSNYLRSDTNGESGKMIGTFV